jgi:precorrin-8X/cobalt-precorrin-8 methylmutase
MTPAEIEALSFEIIEKEAGPHDFSPEQWAIVRRMIHTSADFDYLKTVRFHPGAVAAGIDAIRNGKTIITDTNMAKAGIRAGDLQRFGARVQCYMADPAVSQKAAAQCKGCCGCGIVGYAERDLCGGKCPHRALAPD